MVVDTNDTAKALLQKGRLKSLVAAVVHLVSLLEHVVGVVADRITDSTHECVRLCWAASVSWGLRCSARRARWSAIWRPRRASAAT